MNLIRDQLEQMIRPYVEAFFEGKRKRHEQDEQLKPKIEYLLSKKNSKLICNLFLTRYDIELIQPRTDSIDDVLYLSNNVIVEFYYENGDIQSFMFSFLNLMRRRKINSFVYIHVNM